MELQMTLKYEKINNFLQNKRNAIKIIRCHFSLTRLDIRVMRV